MKVIIGQKNREPTLQEVVNHLHFVYEDKVGTYFDEFCVSKYEFIFENGKPKFAFVIYNKVKVKIANTDGYWPIDTHGEDIDVTAAIENLRKLNAT